MSGWWDDFCTLLFKRAVLLGEQAKDVVSRYLDFVWRVTIILLPLLGALLLCFVVCIALSIQSPWVYQTLILLIAGILLVMIIVALPLLVLSQAVYELVPERLKNALLAWQRRGGAILFGALLAVVIIRVFRLWQSPSKMMTVLLILAVLWVGGCWGGLKLSDAWRRFVTVRLQMMLIVIAVVSLLPGPAGIVEEFGGWARARAEAVVFRVTRPTPERWNPASADELRFVDEGTGAPLMWYHLDEQGDYHLFKSKGYGHFGKPLKRAETEEEFTAIHSWQRARDFERETARAAQEEAAARRQEDERIAAAQRADELARREEEQRIAEGERVAELAREAERSRLASYVLGLPKGRVNYIVFFVDSAGKPSSEVTSAVVNGLTSRSVSAAGDVFSDAFISPQGFDAVAAGKGAADVVAMRLGDVADRLLLIRGGDVQSVPSSSVSGLRTYSMHMAISLIDAVDGKKLTEFVIGNVTGADLSAAGAKTAFIERFAETVAARDDLLAGLP